jgi:hypothetical protein
MSLLPLFHLVDLHAWNLRFDDQGKAGRQDFDNRFAGFDDAAGRVVIQADDGTRYGRLASPGFNRFGM